MSDSKVLPKLKEEMIVKIDNRERRSAIPDLIISRGWQVEFDNLPSGDYVCGKVAIERKTPSDFISSVHNGRLQIEIAKMCSDPLNYEGVFLFVTSTLDELISSCRMSNPESWTCGTIMSCRRRGATTIFTESEHRFVMLFENAIEKYHDGKDRTADVFVKRVLRRNPTEYEILSNAIEGIPGVGPEMANTLFSHFGTIKRIVNATEDELKQVDGVGPKTASRLVMLFNYDANTPL